MREGQQHSANDEPEHLPEAVNDGTNDSRSALADRNALPAPLGPARSIAGVAASCTCPVIVSLVVSQVDVSSRGPSSAPGRTGHSLYRPKGGNSDSRCSLVQGFQRAVGKGNSMSSALGGGSLFGFAGD